MTDWRSAALMPVFGAACFAGFWSRLWQAPYDLPLVFVAALASGLLIYRALQRRASGCDPLGFLAVGYSCHRLVIGWCCPSWLIPNARWMAAVCP